MISGVSTGNVSNLLSLRVVALADLTDDHPSRMDMFRARPHMWLLSLSPMLVPSTAASKRGAPAAQVGRERDHTTGVLEESSSAWCQGCCKLCMWAAATIFSSGVVAPIDRLAM